MRSHPHQLDRKGAQSGLRRARRGHRSARGENSDSYDIVTGIGGLNVRDDLVPEAARGSERIGEIRMNKVRIRIGFCQMGQDVLA